MMHFGSKLGCVRVHMEHRDFSKLQTSTRKLDDNAREENGGEGGGGGEKKLRTEQNRC